MTDKKTVDWSQLNTGLEKEIQRILVEGAQAASDDILKYSTRITTLMSTAISQGRKDITEELGLQVQSLAAIHRIRLSKETQNLITTFIGQAIRVLAIALV